MFYPEGCTKGTRAAKLMSQRDTSTSARGFLTPGPPRRGVRAEEGQVKYLKGDVSYRFIITLLRFVVLASPST